MHVHTPTATAPAAARALHTLPRDVAAFTGREDELHRLLTTTENDSAQVVAIHTVDGMPGVGKTALVTHAAHRLAERYPDGQLFVDLHAHTAGQNPADPSGILATLLISIGISPQDLPGTLEERAALWRDRLADRRMLLILDNAIDPAQVEPLLPASPQCLVLLTSRRRLIALDGAEPLPLDTLPPDQAARLFTRLARRTPTEGDRSAVTEAVRLCGHLPLAITLLAARLSHHPTWDIITFTDEFATAQDRLGELEAGNRAVAAAFDLSYRDLTPHLQRLFRYLGLHPGPDIDPYATAALADIPLAQARRHLETLYADHLIEEPTRHRYRLHDLLREYAHTLTAHDPTDTRTQATHRLLAYYTHTAQTADHYLTTAPHLRIPTPTPDTAPEFTTHEHALTWMRTEYLNLIACAHHPTDRTQPTHLIALANAMAAYLRQQGPWDQAATLHYAAATTAHHTKNRLGQAGALWDLGGVRQLMGDYPGAVDLLGQALEQFRALGNHLGEAGALWCLGGVRRLTGDYGGAADLLGEALERFRALGSRLGEANVLRDLGAVRRLTGDYGGAADLLGEALERFRALGSRLGEANVLRDLGAVRRLTGDYGGAAGLLGQALEQFRALGNRHGEANTLCALGMERTQVRDFDTATELLARSRKLFKEIGDTQGEAEALNATANLLAESAEVRQALATYQQALLLARQIRSPLDEAHALEGMAHCQARTGNTRQAAIASLREALAIYQRIGAAETPAATQYLTRLEAGNN